MQGCSDLDQNASAPMLFPRELVQTEGLERGAELGREDCNFDEVIIVKSCRTRTSQKGDSADNFSRNQQGRRHGSLCMTRDEPRIAADIEMIDEKWATLLHHIHCDGYIAGAPSDTTKRLCLGGIGFGTDEFPIDEAPEIGATGAEEGAGKGAERREELARFAAVKSGSGKFEKKLLKSLFRLRRTATARISSM